MRHLRSRASIGALLSAAALFAGVAVKADIIPVFNVATPLGGGVTEFSYNVSVASGSKVNPNDYFTIYDFNSYIAGSAFAPVDWAISVQNSGVTPSGQLINDDPSIVNITFTYTGATLIGPVNPIGGPGAFGADTTATAIKALGQYTSQTHKHNPGHPDNNTIQSNQGFLVTPAAVPETSSLMLLVPGLVPLGIMLRRRARK
jgi:hypothetical protein